MEQRLEQLRSEALHHGVVSGVGVAPAGAPFPQATPENGYYGLPLLKRPTWTWEVPTYFFVGGAAGASALVAAVGGARGASEALVRDARWIAAAGGALSGGLLTADLGRPARFLNMLRVFKLQSPMSVGAWTLTTFSTAAGAAAFADLVTTATDGAVPVTMVGDAAGALAAATGLVMATYTGVLIGATAIPAWNRHVRMLPIHFAASGLASAVSILELLGHDDPALNRIGIAAAAIEVGTGAWLEFDDDELSRPLKRGASGWITRAGGLLSGPVPLALRLWDAAARQRSEEGAAAPDRRRRVTAAITLAGALLTRFGWWAAGSQSADDPRAPLQLKSFGALEASRDRRADLDR